MPMLAEVISIGDELTSGQRLDTNSQWLSQQLGDLGVRVGYHTTVADDLAANVAVFRQAVDRADVVVATGGLGPTADDLTRDALAATLGTELVLDEASLAHIQQLFTRSNRPMPERNRSQAMFPAGSRPIFNPCGTAPGIHAIVPRAGRPAVQVFALPGVPAEMREMFFQTVSPAIAGLQSSPRVIRHFRLKCFGAGESQVEQMLPDLIRRGREPSVGITVHEATITLRITAAGPTPEACQTAIEPTADTIRQCLGNLVFGSEDDELQDVVLRRVAELGQTLATVEIGTRGLLARWLSEAQVGQPAFLGGWVLADGATAPGELDTHLSASTATATTSGPAPPKTPADPADATRSPAAAEVAALAEACRRHFAADHALAMGKFPTPGAGLPKADDKPGEYCFALATADKTQVHSGTLAGHPAIWKPRAAKQALNLLRLRLSKQDSASA